MSTNAHAAERARLQQRHDEIMDMKLAPKSKKNYTNSTMRFLSWLFLRGEAILNKRILSFEFRNGIVGDEPTQEYMAAFLDQKPRVSPIDFSSFDGGDFTMWLTALQTEAQDRSGKPLTSSTMGGHRSALRHLFRENNRDLDDFTSAGYDDFFACLKRDTAVVKGGGVGKVLRGKLPLSFKGFQTLCTAYRCSDTLEDVFAHCFLTLQWNLMCGSASTASICFSHIMWKNDGVRSNDGVVFPRMKNDQSGERPREPRNIYSNPTTPTVCPILSLAIYFACFPSISGRQLFPGAAQEERFRKRHIFLSRPPLSTVLQELGLSPDDIGTHSIRKGSATYCSSGSTACPPSSSIRLRAGWATGAVHELYCQYEQAGDQHVGRKACGLPIDTPEFASLPPHFDVNSDTVSQASMAVYPALYRVAPAVASFCLASLLFHDSHLSATLPARHPLRQTHYSQNTELKNAISRLVVCSSSRHDSLKPTGVPPHVSLLVHG